MSCLTTHSSGVEPETVVTPEKGGFWIYEDEKCLAMSGVFVVGAFIPFPGKTWLQFAWQPMMVGVFQRSSDTLAVCRSATTGCL